MLIRHFWARVRSFRTTCVFITYQGDVTEIVVFHHGQRREETYPGYFPGGPTRAWEIAQEIGRGGS